MFRGICWANWSIWWAPGCRALGNAFSYHYQINMFHVDIPAWEKNLMWGWHGNSDQRPTSIFDLHTMIRMTHGWPPETNSYNELNCRTRTTDYIIGHNNVDENLIKQNVNRKFKFFLTVHIAIYDHVGRPAISNRHY